ncbi:hypothetical protein [Sphingomonas sp. 2SG]|uniref:hypothetical protein n=1 Tax=Sphingomonas sp. 2SG TaxID=2502201 RepID=UPI0014851CC3|nr:hypothetical protein [Sphingomonas sp. 2SG]
MALPAALEDDEAGEPLDLLDRHLDARDRFNAEVAGDLGCGAGECVQPRHSTFSF